MIEAGNKGKKIMIEDDWTKLTSKDVDIPAFLKSIEKMKAGGTMTCPFCGGKVRMTVNQDGKNEYACDSCDMKIVTEAK